MNWMKSFVERILKNKVFWCCVLCVTALSFTAVCYANSCYLSILKCVLE